MIQMLVVTGDAHDKQFNEPIRVMVSTGQRNREYTPINIAIRDNEQYNALLKQAKDELAAFTRKYKIVEELKELILEIEEWL